jgi:hypothetical protein
MRIFFLARVTLSARFGYKADLVSRHQGVELLGEANM